MKILISMFAFFLCLGSVLAQPTTISYQGKLLDNAGLPVNLNNVTMTFAIYDSPSGGSQIWPSGSPASKTVNVNVGLYSVTLGTGVGSDELIDPSIFDGVSAYLEVSVSATILPRTPVSSVPSAMISNQLSTNGWASPGAIGSTTPNSGSFSAVTIGTGTTTYTFPSSRGSNGQVLQSNASGVLDWATPNQGTVTNVTGTAPISSTGGATPAISISAATTSAAGSMSAADKTKLDGIATNANNYVHPTGDGNLHVPATGTTNSGKVLTAGATAGSLSWETPASGGSTKQYIVKSTNTERTDQTTISDDPHLSVALSANKKYFIRISLVSVRTGATNGKLRSGIRYSGQASSDYCSLFDFKPDATDGTGISWNNTVVQDDITFSNSVTSTVSPDDIEIIFNTTTAGTFAYQWGNRDVDGFGIRMLKGSFMIVEELP